MTSTCPESCSTPITKREEDSYICQTAEQDDSGQTDLKITDDDSGQTDLKITDDDSGQMNFTITDVRSVKLEECPVDLLHRGKLNWLNL